MPDPDDLNRGLRRLGERLDAASRPTTPDSAMERVAPPSPSRQRRLVPAVAVAVLVIGVLVALRLDGDDSQPVDAVDHPTTTIAGETATSAPVNPGETRSQYVGGVDGLPTSGVAIVGRETVTFLSDDGQEVGQAEGQIVRDLEGRSGTDALVISEEGVLRLEGPAQVAGPAGCDDATTSADVRIALCGGQEQIRTQIVRVADDGQTTVIADAAPGSKGVGHWRWAEPSPDGRWVLAQWSGECEVPTAFLFPTDGGNPMTVDGHPGLSEQTVESTGSGWTSDGRVIVHLGVGFCGNGSEGPGAYLVDPATLDAVLLRPDPEGTETVVRWYREQPDDALTETVVPEGWPTTPVFAAVLLDESVVLADPTTGEPVLELLPPNPGRGWGSVALAPDGQTVYLASRVDYGGGDVVRLAPGSVPEVIGEGAGIAVSPDGLRLAIMSPASRSQDIVVIDTTTGEELARIDMGTTASGRGDLLLRSAQWHPDGDQLLVEAGNPEEPSALFRVEISSGSAARIGPPEDVTRGTGWALAGSDGADGILVIEACCSLDANSYDGGSSFVWVDETTGAERDRAPFGSPYARAFVNASGDLLVIDACCGSSHADLFRREPNGELIPLGGPRYAMVDW